MKQHLESKTVMGLSVLLAVTVFLSFTGHLTPEAVDVLKWLGASYMSVRIAANVGESLPKNRKGSERD